MGDAYSLCCFSDSFKTDVIVWVEAKIFFKA